jgi:RNA polymerase sigma factor (sigma-70 family)
VDHDTRHFADYQLAQHCLDGNAVAIAALQRQCGSSVAAYLLRAGALPHEAEDFARSLWADVLTATEERAARLRRYNGTCAIQTWLNAVALNRLLTYKRSVKRRREQAPVTVGARDDESYREEWPASGEPSGDADPPLIEIMQSAIEQAFRECEPEEFVLLQLAHCDRLKGAELAVIFGCDAGAISRRIKKAEAKIASSTLRHVRSADPWLDLKWEDFAELCRAATPACFGVD